MNKKTLFDPTKPFGKIMGSVEGHPTAAYEQNGCLFNRNHRHLNTDFQPPSPPTDQEAADRELLIKLNSDLHKITAILADIGPRVGDGTATAQEKTKHTKATKRHAELVEEIASIEQ